MERKRNERSYRSGYGYTKRKMASNISIHEKRKREKEKNKETMSKWIKKEINGRNILGDNL